MKRNMKRGIKSNIKRGHKRNIAKTNKTKPQEEKAQIDLDFEKNPTDFFTKNATFEQHYEAQNKNKERYLATIMACEEYQIEILPSAKARILAAAFARHDQELIEYAFKNFGFVDVLKAVTLLDSGREKKALEKKLERIQKCGSVMKPQKLAKFKVDINNLGKQAPKMGSCSGALARKIKKWVRSFDKAQLEFFALHMPLEPWKKLANIVHLNPNKDFPDAPWFLPYCYGEEPPKDSKIAKCKGISDSNVNELVKEFDLPFSFVKPYSSSLSNASKKKLADNLDKLDTILWNYEELKCPEVDDIIRARLENEEKVELGYGKLMERLLMLRDMTSKTSFKSKDSIFSLIIPHAEERLKAFKSTLPGPVAILGDASASMSVAIRTATIISSLLTAICSAELSFFNTATFKAKEKPKNVAEVLELAYNTRASGATAPAAGIVPYYNVKKVIKTFVIVTDEEENTSARTADDECHRFFGLFMEYRKKVFPATLIFISFLRNQHDNGQMYDVFKKSEVPDVLQFKFSGQRPDLSKLDSILGMISSKSSTNFEGFIEQLESDLKTKNVSKQMTNLNVNAEEKKTTEDNTFMKFTQDSSEETTLKFGPDDTEQVTVKFS